jgi:hypothetical protein
VLGRYGEEPRTWTSRIRITVAGTVVLASELAAGPAAGDWSSRAVLGGARAVSILVVLDPSATGRAAQTVPAKAAWADRGIALPLGGGGYQFTAWGAEIDECRTTLEAQRTDSV